MRPETTFSHWLCDTLKAQCPGIMIQRIETTTGPGVPDIWCNFGWIETKVLKDLPPTSNAKAIYHPVGSEQDVWLSRCVESSPRVGVWIAARSLYDKKVYIVDVRRLDEPKEVNDWKVVDWARHEVSKDAIGSTFRPFQHLS